MQLIFFQDTKKKTLSKITLLVGLSYFFLGISEGTFLFFPNLTDTAINFSFTLFCVWSCWLLFKRLRLTLINTGNRVFTNTAVLNFMLIFVLTSYVTLLNWFYINVMWGEKLQHTPYFSIILPMALVLFVGWVYLYDWYLKGFRSTSQQEEKTVEVRKGNRKIIKPLKQTFGFLIENQLVFLVDENGERFLSDYTLSELERQLETDGFFRINRQLLTKKSAIISYHSDKNDKVKLSLRPELGLGEHALVSRYKAPAFRAWIRG